MPDEYSIEYCTFQTGYISLSNAENKYAFGREIFY